jgi:beta-lactamase class A
VAAVHLASLDGELSATPGTISVWYGRVGAPPAYARAAQATHYAASTMKTAVLAALHRSADAGAVNLGAAVSVHNEFVSAVPAAPSYGCRHNHDNDDAVWHRMGATATLGWLAERMIVRSSNLATNLVLAHIGLAAVADVWRIVGARHSMVGRGIEDSAAADAGVTNLVTAADLAALLSAIAMGAHVDGPLASRAACRVMLDTLLAQECTEDLAAGLPPGTRVAHKNGWIPGVRHGGGVVFPDDAPTYAVVVCATTPLAVNQGGDEACRLVARIAAASWADRHSLGAAAGG